MLIDSITIEWKDNTVVYDDTDSSTDYWHAYSLPLKEAIKWVKEDGDNKIVVHIVNGYTDEKYIKRIFRIARECGYSVEKKIQERIQSDGHVWEEISYILTKIGGS